MKFIFNNHLTIKILLILIIVIGGFLRLLDLGQIPIGVTGDEIQQGYTGYSILKTGKDEWGDFMPINPRGFGDYKPPLYSYLTIPFEAVGGLNITTVRLPSALAGTATVLVVYFLGEELFGSCLIGLLSALLLAISPWAIEYSRFAHESNPGVLLFSLGLLFFLKGLKNHWLLILSAFCFGLSLYTYFSFKLFSVLMAAFLVTFFRKQLKSLNRRFTFGAVGVFVVFLLVAVSAVVFSGGGRRASDASLLNTENLGSLRDIQTSDSLPQPWGRIINNKEEYLLSQFTQNYLGYFSTSFFFSPNRSDDSVYNFPGRGLLYLWESLLFIVGIGLLLVKEYRYKLLIFTWLLFAPLAAALTREYMHTQRVETFLPLPAIISALALVWLIGQTRKFVNTGLIYVGIAVIIIWSVIGRIDYYLYHQFNQNLGGIKYGYQAAVNYAEQHQNDYNQIIFTKQNSEPQAFVAFYSAMDPSYYQSYSQNWKSFESFGFAFLDMTNYSLGKYHFENIDWEKDKTLPNTLIIATPPEIPSDVTPLKKIRDPYGHDVFLIVDTKHKA